MWERRLNQVLDWILEWDWENAGLWMGFGIDFRTELSSGLGWMDLACLHLITKWSYLHTAELSFLVSTTDLKMHHVLLMFHSPRLQDAFLQGDLWFFYQKMRSEVRHLLDPRNWGTRPWYLDKPVSVISLLLPLLSIMNKNKSESTRELSPPRPDHCPCMDQSRFLETYFFLQWNSNSATSSCASWSKWLEKKIHP